MNQFMYNTELGVTSHARLRSCHLSSSTMIVVVLDFQPLLRYIYARRPVQELCIGTFRVWALGSYYVYRRFLFDHSIVAALARRFALCREHVSVATLALGLGLVPLLPSLGAVLARRCALLVLVRALAADRARALALGALGGPPGRAVNAFA